MDSLHLSSTYRFLRRSALSLCTPMLLGGMVIAPDLLIPEAVRAQSADTFNTQQLLRFGDRNANVLRMQQMLVELNYLNATIPTYAIEGYFGPETRIAIEQLQRDYQLSVDGIAGPDTLGRLVDLVNPGRADIAYMQAQLKALLYYDGIIDGQIGEQTRGALRNMQSEIYLPVNPDGSSIEKITQTVDDYYKSVRKPRNLPSDRFLAQQVEESIGVARGGREVRPPFQIPSWTESSNATSQPYIVMLPYRGNFQFLQRIRNFAPNASLKNHPRGEYVQAGSFPSRSEAEDLKKLLVEEGLVGARVIFVQ